MNSDPAGFAGGMNWFAYSAGDPINLMDPLGLGPADSERYTWMDGVQDGIGTLGFIPAVGAIPDGVNGVIYLFRGRYGDAGFSLMAMVPLAGDLVAGARYADKLNDVRRIADGAGEVADDIYVLGRQVDTAVAKDWPGHQVLDIPDLTIRKNDAWMQDIIDKGGEVYLGSPQTRSTLWDAVNNRPTVFARELEQLRAAGYRQVGNSMIPPIK